MIVKWLVKIIKFQVKGNIAKMKYTIHGEILILVYESRRDGAK